MRAVVVSESGEPTFADLPEPEGPGEPVRVLACGLCGSDVEKLRPEFADYVVGLEGYSHLKVIYWLTEMTETHGLHRPQGNPDAPVVGMFACR